MTVSFNSKSGKTKITLSWTETRQLRSGMIDIKTIRDSVNQAHDLATKNENKDCAINKKD